MRIFLYLLVIVNIVIAGIACQKGNDAKEPEPTREEITASVPELDDLHEVIHPLWHSAFPEKNYDLIKELLPQLDSLTARVDTAQLAGILQDKQADWDEGKKNLKLTMSSLHKAVAADDKEAMLKEVEALHAAFAGLMRVVRPKLPELENFHQEMYKLYHYYLPNYDLDKIRATAPVMQEKINTLKQLELSGRFAAHKEKFDLAIAELENAVTGLNTVVQSGNKNAITEAIEKVHSAYQSADLVLE